MNAHRATILINPIHQNEKLCASNAGVAVYTTAGSGSGDPRASIKCSADMFYVYEYNSCGTITLINCITRECVMAANS